MPSFYFAAFTYESEQRTLSRHGRPVHAEPKVLACMEAFLRSPGQTLSTSTLLANLWPDAHVGASALRRVIVQVRRLLDPEARGDVLITVPPHGYRLTVAVTQRADRLRLHAPGEVPSFESVQGAQQRLHLGPYTLHSLERTLTLAGRTIPLEGKAFDCLLVLARSPNRLVDHARLSAALWPEREPGPHAAKRVLRALRTALADTPGELRVVARKGLGYVLEVLPAWQLATEPVGYTPMRDARPEAAVPHDVVAPAGRVVTASDTDSASLALDAARALWQADGDSDAVCTAYRRAFELARSARDHTLMAEAAIGAAVGEESAFALAEGTFRQRTSTAELEYALASLPARASSLRHRLARTLCWVRGALGDRPGAHAAARIALQDMPAPASAAQYTMALAVACMESVWSQNRPRARLALRKLLDAVGARGLTVEQRIEAHFQAMTLSLVLGEASAYKASRAALAALAEALPVRPPATRLGQRQAIYRLGATLALVTLATIEGDFRDAERHLTELTLLSQKLGLQTSGDLGVFVLMLLPTLRYQGRSALLAPLVASAPFPNELVRATVALQVALDGGDVATASSQFAMLRAHRFSDSAGTLARTDVLVALADACVTLGDAHDARLLRTQLLPWSEFCASEGAVVSLGAASRALGELERMLGAHSDAERRFRRALQLNRKLGHRPELVRSKLGLARVLAARGDGSGEAAILVREARRDAAAMGMEPWLAADPRP